MLGKVYRQEGMVSRAKAEFDRCVALQQRQSAKPSEAELEKEKGTGHEE